MVWFGKQNTQKDEHQVGALPEEEVSQKVEQFVSENPLSVYLINGDRNSQKSTICRKNENGGQTCLNLSINGITLFKTMQGKNFFCSLPPDVDATHFECRKIT